ncbi:MAG TPA: hypothetical protein VFB62_22720 [Polyangiaceae bacterium]|nr:hypothetical protein [Polyangiaceae bacterium]
MRRPRLAPHVLARHHRVAEKRLIVLHDTHADAIATVGEREFTVLRAADGTRDVEGIVAACAAEGRPVRADHVVEFLDQLAGAGMLREGILEPPRMTPPRAERPLLALEGFRLHCDGGGTCCRIYPTTAFSPAEAESLREAEFMPEHGSTFYPWLARSVAMIDGRCAFLAPDGACVLHCAGKKPSGCRMYPAVFVDDGNSLRVTAAPECRCVFASARINTPPGPPVTGGVSLVELFDPQAAHVEVLPEELPLTDELMIDRNRANAISDEIDAASGSDAVALLDGLGEQLGAGQLGAGDELARMARRLDHHNAQNTWRSESDFARAVPRWMRAAIDRADGVVDEEGERFYVRAVAFGRLWFRSGEPPFAIGLRRRAARLWIARRLRADGPLASDRALDEPIALVEAVCRSFGL